jgi:alpha-glucosidase
MKTLKNWVLGQKTAEFIELRVDEKHLFRLYVLEQGLCRVLIKQKGALALDRTGSGRAVGRSPAGKL